MRLKKCAVVFIVEGKNDKDFYEKTLDHFGCKRNYPHIDFKVIDISGVGNFKGKGKRKFDNHVENLTKKYGEIPVYAFLCYDKDVFSDRRQSPPFNFDDLKKELLKSKQTKGVEGIVAVEQIEDWYLIDIDGICKYLGISKPKKINGATGVKKMEELFKRSTKGAYTKSETNFLNSLNLYKVTSKAKTQLKKIEDIAKTHT